MFLKIMSGDEKLADCDSRKTFQLFDKVTCVTFNRAPDGEPPRARIVFEGDDDIEDFPVPGNAYLMNDQGKTIASFGVGHPSTG